MFENLAKEYQIKFWSGAKFDNFLKVVKFSHCIWQLVIWREKTFFFALGFLHTPNKAPPNRVRRYNAAKIGRTIPDPQRFSKKSLYLCAFP
jgi:hypothetical protein